MKKIMVQAFILMRESIASLPLSYSLLCGVFNKYTPIPVYLRIGFLASSTIKLLDNELILKLNHKTFLI